MIGSIQHKGLKLLWTKGDQGKLPATMIPKILRILTIIDALEIVPEDLQDLPCLCPHPLKGDFGGFGQWMYLGIGAFFLDLII